MVTKNKTMVDFIIGLEFLALWHPKYTINDGHFYLGNEDKTKGVMEFYERNDILKLQKNI